MNALKRFVVLLGAVVGVLVLYITTGVAILSGNGKPSGSGGGSGGGAW